MYGPTVANLEEFYTLYEHKHKDLGLDSMNPQVISATYRIPGWCRKGACFSAGNHVRLVFLSCLVMLYCTVNAIPPASDYKRHNLPVLLMLNGWRHRRCDLAPRPSALMRPSSKHTRQGNPLLHPFKLQTTSRGDKGVAESRNTSKVNEAGDPLVRSEKSCWF